MKQRVPHTQKNDFSGSRLVFYDDDKSSNSLAEFINTHRDIDLFSLYDFLLFGSILPPHSPLSGVGQLYPGESIENGISTLAYQELDYTVKNKSIPEFVDALDRLLSGYFSEHHSESNLLLSGGIDSAILLSYMPKGASCITWGGRGEETSDVLYSKITAEHFKVGEHRFVYADYEKDFELYKDAVQKLKVPILFNSAVPFLRMAEVGRGMGMTKWLMGQNADTLFMSYPAPVFTKNFSKLNALLPFNPLHFAKTRKSYLLSTPSIVRLLAYFKSLSVYPGGWISVPDAYFKEKESLVASFPVKNIDQKIIVLEELLTESRRNQVCQNEVPALFGITTDCPYYEQKFIELALSIPPKLRGSGGYKKLILKELAKKRGVPDAIINKQKSGLSYGLDSFILGKKHLPIWDEMEGDELLNQVINVKKFRSCEQDNYLAFIMLSSLHYWFELIAKPEGLKLSRV